MSPTNRLSSQDADPTGPPNTYDDSGSIWWADYDLGAEINGASGEDAADGRPLPHIMRPLAADLASFLRYGGNAG